MINNALVLTILGKRINIFKEKKIIFVSYCIIQGIRLFKKKSNWYRDGNNKKPKDRE